MAAKSEVDNGQETSIHVFSSSSKILGGFTAKRLLQLAPKLVEQRRLKCVKTANITVEQAKGVAEIMFVASALTILPINEWDEKPNRDGRVGELTMALSDLLWEDMVAGPETLGIRAPCV